MHNTQVGNKIFNPEDVCGAIHDDESDPHTLTILLKGGHTMSFQGEEADFLWEYFKKVTVQISL